MFNREVYKKIPFVLDEEEIANYVKIPTHSSRFSRVRKLIEFATQNCEINAVTKHCKCEYIADNKIKIDDVIFDNILLSRLLKDKKDVVLYVCNLADIDTSTITESMKFMYELMKSPIINAASQYLRQSIKNKYGYEEISSLHPGSIPVWGIESNYTIVDMIGNVLEELNVSFTETGYLTPFSSTTGIIFEDHTNYLNCIICKKLDCISRHKPFDEDRYNQLLR